MTDQAQIGFVTDQMRTFTEPIVTPLSYEPDDNTVRLAGPSGRSLIRTEL